METLRLILFLAVLGVLGTGGVLYLWGGGDGVFTDEGAEVVGAPAERVFLSLLDPDDRKRWVEGASDCRRQDFGAWKVGSELLETLEREGRTLERTLRVVEIQEGKSVAFETEEDGIAIRYRYQLGAHNTGRSSRVLFSIEARYHGFWNELLEPLRGGALFERTRRELAVLAGLDLVI